MNRLITTALAENRYWTALVAYHTSIQNSFESSNQPGGWNGLQSTPRYLAMQKSLLVPDVGVGDTINVQIGATTFNLSQSGTYRLVGTVTALNTGLNSFFIDIDSNPGSDEAKSWHIIPAAGLQSVQVSWNGTGVANGCYDTPACAEFNPKTFTLSSGTHTIYINNRETGTGVQDIRFELYTSPVSSKFQMGDRVRINNTGVNIRTTPAGTIAGSKNTGDSGTVIGGPTPASLSGVPYIWWKIDFDTDPDGCIAEDYADKAAADIIYTLTTPTPLNGSISKSPNQSTYNQGDPVILTAIPNSGYTLSSWSVSPLGNAGAGCSGTGSCTVTMSSNTTVTANFSPVVITGSTFYIRDGATSSSCTDWTNACDSLPGTLQRGATYYIADGSYGSYTFDDPVFGTQLITIKKATASDHGTNTGWSSSYGSGQAVFGGTIRISSSYITIDGQVGGGLGDWKGAVTPLGFKINVTSANSGSGIDVARNMLNIVVKHFEIEGNGGDGDNPGNIENDGIVVRDHVNSILKCLT